MKSARVRIFRRRITRWMGAVPTVVVGGLWVILCQAWPSRVPEAGPRHLPAPPPVACVAPGSDAYGADRMQLVFLHLPGEPGLLSGEEPPGAPHLMLGTNATHRLPRSAGSDARRAFLGVPALPNLARYHPADPPRKAFGRAGGEGRLRFLVEASRELREAGFQLGDVDAARLGNTNNVWQAELVVECAEDGSVESVFIRSAEGDAAFRSGLARFVAREGRATPGRRARGQLTISHGIE